MFRYLANNIKGRWCNGLTYGVNGACAGGAVIGGIMTLFHFWSQDTAPYPDDQNAYVIELCHKYQCYYRDDKYHPGYKTARDCTSQPPVDVDGLIKDYNASLNHLWHSNTVKYLTQFALPIGASIGLGLGFAYGFICVTPRPLSNAANHLVIENAENIGDQYGQYVPPPIILPAAAQEAELVELENQVEMKEPLVEVKVELQAQRAASISAIVEKKKAVTNELTNQERLERLKIEDVYSAFKDPVSYEIMNKAVNLPCGHSCDESTANQISKCSMCRAPFNKNEVKPNFSLRSIIDEFLQKKESEKAAENSAAASKKESESSQSTYVSELDTPLTHVTFNRLYDSFFSKKLSAGPGGDTSKPTAGAATP